MSRPVMLEVREQRGPFGRAVKWAFFLFQIVTLGAGLTTCSLVGRYLGADDPEVALGAGLFGVQTLSLIMGLWPVGTILLGVLALATRGRRRLIPAPPESTAGA